MIHRGGYELAKEASQKLRALLEKEPFPSPETLEALPYMLSLDLPAGTDLRWDGFDFAADGIGKGERYGTG